MTKASPSPTIAALIAELSKAIDHKDAEARPLRDALDAVQTEIDATAWILDTLPGGTRYAEAKHKRDAAHKRQGQLRRSLQEIEEDVSRLKSQRTQAENEQAEAVRAATPEGLEGEITKAMGTVADLAAQIGETDAAHRHAQSQMRTVHDAIAHAGEARKFLADLNGKAFLAKGPKRATLESEITDAEMAVSVAEQAEAGAVAARPMVEARIAELADKLADLTSRHEGARRVVQDLQRQRVALQARAAIGKASELLSEAHALMTTADPHAAWRLVMAWRDVGFVTLNDHGKHESPEWLRRAAAAQRAATV